jgi:hypothetical protein
MITPWLLDPRWTPVTSLLGVSPDTRPQGGAATSPGTSRRWDNPAAE